MDNGLRAAEKTLASAPPVLLTDNHPLVVEYERGSIERNALQGFAEAALLVDGAQVRQASVAARAHDLLL